MTVCRKKVALSTPCGRCYSCLTMRPINKIFRVGPQRRTSGSATTDKCYSGIYYQLHQYIWAFWGYLDYPATSLFCGFWTLKFSSQNPRNRGSDCKCTSILNIIYWNKSTMFTIRNNFYLLSILHMYVYSNIWLHICSHTGVKYHAMPWNVIE